MDIDEFIETNGAALRNVVFNPSFPVFIELIQKMSENDMDKLLLNPSVDDSNMKRDIRWKMGRVDGQKSVIEISKQISSMR